MIILYLAMCVFTLYVLKEFLKYVMKEYNISWQRLFLIYMLMLTIMNISSFFNKGLL
jgi:hypothetical protein